jgi:hypothetical protein
MPVGRLEMRGPPGAIGGGPHALQARQIADVKPVERIAAPCLFESG